MAKVMVCDGNKAAAQAVKLARPDLIALYPITPQTPLVEQLARFVAQGVLDCDLIRVEGENSALGAVMAAGAAGGRSFTATSSMGLEYMYDGLILCAGHRVPVVMVNVNREIPSIRTVSNGRSGIVGVTEAGWVQVEAETCQEILDCILMAYRLAEDPDILLPVMVGYDGYYLSHLSEPVEVPDQDTVDAFFASLADKKEKRTVLRPGGSLNFGPTIQGRLFAEFRQKHSLAMQAVKQKIGEVEEEFHRHFGRRYDGMVESYRADDADIVLVTAGSCTGTAREVVDQLRDKGEKVGLVKIRMFRPFPREALAKALAGKKAAAVIDRSVCLGWNCGHLYMELRGVLPDMEQPVKLVDFIDGLANDDITQEHLLQALDLTRQALAGKAVPEVNWLNLM